MGSTFADSEAYVNIYNFILAIDDSIKNHKQVSSPHHMDILIGIARIINETEKSTLPQRYANEAAKDVFQKINDEYEDEYLRNSFGNVTRLDYGTGHELNYLCYLYNEYCEKRIELNCVFKTLMKYFEVIRLFITKFNLEPAGSHGIWGLDDFQLLPFLFGSSELFNTKLSFEDLNEGCYFAAVKEKLGGTSLILKSMMGKEWPCINRGMIRKTL